MRGQKLRRVLTFNFQHIVGRLRGIALVTFVKERHFDSTLLCGFMLCAHVHVQTCTNQSFLLTCRQGKQGY